MPGITVRDGESIDRALKVFKRQMEKAGIRGELKKREHYEKPSIRKKRKSIAARKRVVKQKRGDR